VFVCLQVTAFLVLTAIAAVLAIAQMIISGIGAEETYDYRTFFLARYDGHCTSVICDEVIAIADL